MELQRLGEYRILEPLGAGGMGTVYKAMHERLNRVAAVKVVSEAFASRSDHLERFKREAGVIAKLRHPNIVTLFDYGEENGIWFYAMEYVDAGTLSAVLDGEPGGLPLNRVLKLADSLCDALAYLHTNGFVHRDIKPSNIMLAADGHVTLMDFGLVKAPEAQALTRAGKSIGTPRYMSPEMIRGEATDARSDVFQLGLVLYEAATGQQPFEGHDVYVLARNLLTATQKPPSAHVKGLGRSFDALIVNCLEKEPADRYQDATELREDLERVRRRTPVRPRRRASAPAEAGGGPGSSGGTVAGTVVSGSKTRFDLSFVTNPSLVFSTPGRRRFGAVGALLLLLLVLASFAGRGGEAPTALDVAVRAEVDGLTVTWRSESPCPSVVQVVDGERPGAAPLLFQGAGPPSTSHRVVLKDLAAGGSYRYAIVYPDGQTSLSQPLPTVATGEVRIVQSFERRPSISVAEVTWETNLPCASRVEYVRRGQRATQPLSLRPSAHHTLAVTGLGFDESLSEVRVTFVSPGRQQVVQAGDVRGAAAALGELLKVLGTFDPAPLLARLHAQLRTWPRARDDAVLRRAAALARRELSNEKAWERVQRYRALLSEVFADRALSVDSVKMPLYKRLRKLETVDALLEYLQCDGVTALSEVYRPFVGLSWSKVAPPGEPLVLATFSDKESAFVVSKASSGRGGAMADRVLNVFGSQNDFEGRERLVLRPDLSAFVARCGERPRLVLRARNLTPEFWFRVLLNDAYVVDFLNKRSTVPPTMWTSIHGPKVEEEALFQQSVNSLIATIPKAFLKSGENTLAVELQLLPGESPLHFVDLVEIRLYPE